MGTRHPDRYRRLLDRLRQARKDAGLSQVAAAKVLGVEQSWLSRVERGERRIDPTELDDFARLYDKPLEYFVR